MLLMVCFTSLGDLVAAEDLLRIRSRKNPQPVVNFLALLSDSSLVDLRGLAWAVGRLLTLLPRRSQLLRCSQKLC